MAIEQDIYDAVILGGGPGGYVAAKRMAQYGLRTALVEEDKLGGTCLNLGCMPSKYMLHTAAILSEIKHARRFGINLNTRNLELNYSQVVVGREQAIKSSRQNLSSLLQNAGITIIKGRGRVTDSHEISVDSSDETEFLNFRNLIIATGSQPKIPDIDGMTLQGVIDSNGALLLTQRPNRAVIIGAGAIGAEWAVIWNSFGTDVMLLESLPCLVPTEDSAISGELARVFRRKHINFETSVKVLEIYQKDETLAVKARIGEGEQIFDADTVLVATGRRPNTENLGLERIMLPFDKQGIPTDSSLRTSHYHKFAIGDVNGRSFLAHAAMHQGIIVADSIAGKNDGRIFDGNKVPAVIFTDPEIARMGLREDDAKAMGIEVKTQQFPFAGLGRAISSGKTEGFAKIVYEPEGETVLGIHMIGQSAGDLIGAACIAVTEGMTLKKLAEVIYPHPTFAEILPELSWTALGYPIHI